MAFFKKVISGLAGAVNGGREDVPDDVTTDRVLKGLRRQDRIQNEGVEKVNLRNKIANFQREETRKNLFGVGDKDGFGASSPFFKDRVPTKPGNNLSSKSPFFKDSKEDVVVEDGIVKRKKKQPTYFQKGNVL